MDEIDPKRTARCLPSGPSAELAFDAPRFYEAAVGDLPLPDMSAHPLTRG